MKKLGKVLDNILLFLILLSIVQVVVDDLSVMYAFSERISLYMLFAGVGFDLIFSIEFIVRSIAALKNKRFGIYFIYEKGWIDLIASLPLLLLNSGPATVAYFTAGSVSASRTVFSSLKVIRAIRVTRILRLLRLLKIFGKIENTESKMNQRHVSTIAAYFVTVSVAVYAIMSAAGLLNLSDPIVNAQVSLTFTAILIVNVFAVAFFYSRQFAQTIGDPIYVMKRGMREDDYNFAVKIKKPLADEEIFELAETYNSVWLPMKQRIQAIRERKKQAAAQTGYEDDYSDLLK